MARVRVNKSLLSKMKRRAKARGENIKAEALQALATTVDEGAELTVQYLEEAVTKTGRRREAVEGGHPGRHDTGKMVHGVSSAVRARAKLMVGVFGWQAGSFEEYMRDQDQGDGFSIPPARALPSAFIVSRERLRQRLDGITE